MQDTVAITRQLIKGKLMEMGHKPQNVQVIVEGIENNSILFLIDEDGIINTIKPTHNHMEHVIGQPVVAT